MQKNLDLGGHSSADFNKYALEILLANKIRRHLAGFPRNNIPAAAQHPLIDKVPEPRWRHSMMIATRKKPSST